ncbi:MAG: HD-GYP domain-containing protein [Candidatus Omnitrophica bacterium]|nr:HD-GYP domain-containing protein [Candidatus Omnitrophota bacterium]
MSESYFPISLHSLRFDTVPPFDLYLLHSSSSPPVLYRHKDTQFTEEVLEKLKQNDVQNLFVPRHQREDYFGYSSKMVAETVRDPDAPVEKKTRVVYDTTATIMEDLFVSPRSNIRIQQAKDTINQAVDLMANDQEATRKMIFLTCHDYYTYTHSVNVTIFATALMQKVLPHLPGEHNYQVIGEGFLLHDIGKSAIPPGVINKPGKLDDEEWRLMRRHPQIGQEILNSTRHGDPIIDAIVLQHHEKMNGQGYPHGLRDDEIHPYARICALADVFDAITTVRSYRDPMPTAVALKVMRDEMGEHFDWDYFNEFVKLFGELNE